MTVREFDAACKKMGNVDFVFSFDNQPRGMVPPDMMYRLQFTKVTCVFNPSTVIFSGISGSISVSNIDHINCDESGEIFTIICGDGVSMVINTCRKKN